jgi:hypothetical protein
MSNDQENLDNFWAVFGQLEEPVPPKVFYRLYHDDFGRPLFWSMQDESGNYIEVDQETYHRQPKHIRVKDGKLVELVVQEIKKLVPADTGVSCHPTDICIVVPEDQPHIKWKVKVNETS